MSSDELRARADQIFQRLLNVEPSERASMLRRECRDDAELRALVEELLSYAEDPDTARLDPGGALGEALRASDLLRGAEVGAKEGDALGSFRLVRKLGEGGAGEVWEAEQSEPVRRRVALKLLHPGLRSESTVARFRSERQALAMMQHPAIAQIFEAGTTDGDRPFLVMELVPGLPITEYCDRHGLSRVERLRLFMKVCAGVQHAHRRGVIHRDLKPSNVLVREGEAEARPKIIDFGLAKPTEGTLSEETMTLDGQVLGTPAYMSPEQTHPSVAGIDTRTDVYALGAILYELLAGARPHEDLTGASIDEVLRIIREVDPRRPSVAAGEHGRPLRGDLDWITMKALEKDRERRYESPAELAADLQRHLDGQPVDAGPPTAGYRAGKFLRRHVLAVGATTVLFVLLGVFTVTLGLQNARIARERDRANEEAERASREAEASTAVTDFLVDLFASPDPMEGAGREVSALSILERGAEKIAELESPRPETKVRVLRAMGDALRGLGEVERSVEMMERAMELSAQGDTLSMAHAAVLQSLAGAYSSKGRYPEAEETWERALAVMSELPDRNDVREAQILNSLGMIRWRLGDVDQARIRLDESVRIQKKVDPRHPGLPRPLNNLAILAMQAGDFETAREHLHLAISIWEETLGPEHPNVASSYANLALTYQEDGDMEGSLPYHRKALAIREKALGPDHPDVAETLNNLGNVYRALDRYEESLAMLERSLAIREKALGPDHTYTATSVFNIGATLSEMGRYDEALPSLVRSLAAFEKALGEDHPHVTHPLTELAQIRQARGDAEGARRYFVRSATICVEKLAPGSPHRQDVLRKFAEFERTQGNDAAADSLEALNRAEDGPAVEVAPAGG